MTRFIFSLCLVFFLPFVAIAQEINDDDVDLYNGRDVNIVCSACHGELGQGAIRESIPVLLVKCEAYFFGNCVVLGIENV